MSSVVLVARLVTGLIILAGVLNRNKPGNWPFLDGGISPISRVGGTYKGKITKWILEIGNGAKLLCSIQNCGFRILRLRQ